MGVWIETSCRLRIFYRQMSHPVWVCGLKHLKLAEPMLREVSHPVWVCGLKLLFGDNIEHAVKSHPVWVCGLKQSL